MKSIEPVSYNIVVLAENLNPSLFTQLWLIKIGVISETDNIEGSFFTPTAVNLITPKFDLLVVPERLQLTIKIEEPREQQEVLNKICGNIIKAIPHTPFTAIGFNMEWIAVSRYKHEFHDILREMFVSEKNPIAPFFKTDDSTFGMSFSKNEIGTRLSLNVSHVINNKEGTHGLRFKFNFHKQIENSDRERAVAILLEMLNNWQKARGIAEEIVMEGSKEWKRS
jgi:hypothetical protein